MSFGFSASGSQQRSENEAGLRGDDALAASHMARSFMSRLLDDENNALNEPLPQFKQGKYGLLEQFDQVAESLGNSLFAQNSGDLASRGFINPQSLQNVVGNSIRGALPMLGDFALQSADRLVMGPENARLARRNSARDLLRTMAPLLGSRGFSQGSATAVGMNAGIGGGSTTTTPSSIS